MGDDILNRSGPVIVERKTRRDLDALGERRREGMALLEEGMSQADVARELSVSRQTVSRWAKLEDAYPDEDAWRGRRLGRPRGMSDGQRAELVRLLVDRYVREQGPRGSRSPKPARWTLSRVAGLIETEFGVSCSLTQVRNVLVGLVGDDQWRVSQAAFWARLIELAHPEWAGRVLVVDFDEDWNERVRINGKVIADLRRRLLSRREASENPNAP
jgi:transposase